MSEVAAFDSTGSLLASLFDTVLQRSGTGVVLLDRNLRYVMANDVAAAINGRSSAAHVGASLFEVVPDVAGDLAPILREVLETGAPCLNVEVTGATPASPDEQRWWMASHVRIDLPDHPDAPFVAVVFTDITAQRRSHDRLRQVIDGLFNFVAICSPEGTVLEANAAALSAAALSIEQVVDRPLWDAHWWSHDATVQSQLRDAIRRAASGETSRYDVEICVADGRLIPIDFQIAPIVDHGRIVALVSSGLDITTRVDEARRLSSLARLSSALNAAESSDAVVAALIDNAGAADDATFLSVAMLDPVARCLTVVNPASLDDEIDRRWSTIPLRGGQPTPLGDAITTRRAVHVPTTAARAVSYPHLEDDARRAGIVATAALPLFDADGEPFAVVGLGWPGPTTLTGPRAARLDLLADLCSQALQRTRRAEVVADLIGHLQAELLAGHDEPAGIDLAVGYQPAVNDIGLGGDWYDAITIDGDTTALVVGDVAGHGIPAAAQMAQVRSTVRAVTRNAPTPAHILSQTTRALSDDRVSFIATAAVAVIDVAAGTLSWVTAGHLPPVHRSADGRTELLWGPCQPPIGMTRGVVAPAQRALEAGSTLVLYTDGLVERRREPIDDGLARLTQVIADLPPRLTAAETRDAVLAAMVPDGAEDDVAIVVATVPGA